MTITARCTCCRKVFEMSPSERREAQDIGCAISRCCFAVAIVRTVRVCH